MQTAKLQVQSRKVIAQPLNRSNGSRSAKDRRVGHIRVGKVVKMELMVALPTVGRHELENLSIPTAKVPKFFGHKNVPGGAVFVREPKGGRAVTRARVLVGRRQRLTQSQRERLALDFFTLAQFVERRWTHGGARRQDFHGEFAAVRQTQTQQLNVAEARLLAGTTRRSPPKGEIRAAASKLVLGILRSDRFRRITCRRHGCRCNSNRK